MRILVIIFCCITQIQAQTIRGWSWTPLHSVGHFVIERQTGITVGGGATWYDQNTLPTATDTITSAADFASLTTGAVAFVKGRINMDGYDGANNELDTKITITGCHRMPGCPFESELYYTSAHSISIENIWGQAMFRTDIDSVKFIGVKIAGKDTAVWYAPAEADKSRAIINTAKGIEIENCEIAYFSRDGIVNQWADCNLEINHSYMHDVSLYHVLNNGNNDTARVTGSRFEWHWTCLDVGNSANDSTAYIAEGNLFIKETRPDTSEEGWAIVNTPNYGGGGKVAVGGHPPDTVSYTLAWYQYNTFSKVDSMSINDAYEQDPVETYDMWLWGENDEETPCCEYGDVIFRYNYVSRAYNSTWGSSWWIQSDVLGTIDTSNNVVNLTRY